MKHYKILLSASTTVMSYQNNHASPDGGLGDRFPPGNGISSDTTDCTPQLVLTTTSIRDINTNVNINKMNHINIVDNVNKTDVNINKINDVSSLDNLNDVVSVNNTNVNMYVTYVKNVNIVNKIAPPLTTYVHQFGKTVHAGRKRKQGPVTIHTKKQKQKKQKLHGQYIFFLE